MKKLIVRTCYFVIPFFLMFLFNCVFYRQTEGDLVRLGNIYFDSSLEKTMKQLHREYAKEKKYSNLSELAPGLTGNFDVVTIGDSFSNQNLVGYQNYLAYENLSVLNVDFCVLGQNPIQALVELDNGDFFDSVKTRYVVLQSVERFVIDRCNELDYGKTMPVSAVREKIAEGVTFDNAPVPIPFFSHNLLNTPVKNIMYNYDDRPRHSQVYMVAGEKRLFSIDSDRILFFKDDYNRIDQKNDPASAKKVVDTVSEIGARLAKKNIKLIFLIAPDKFDMYHSQFARKDRYTKPLFFEHYAGIPKDYLDVPAYSVIGEAIGQGMKDVYYYDDTHWSPKSSQFVAKEIYKLISADAERE